MDAVSASPSSSDKPGGASAEDVLVLSLGSGRWKKYARLVLAALGSVPWVGGLISASASFSAERNQDKLNDLQRLWLEEHRQKSNELGATLQEIISRLDGFGDAASERVMSEEYLVLVRRAFRSWDQADTAEKRDMLKRLVMNAGVTTLCPDDLIRLFIGWIDLYHEAHFIVIREVYKNPGITRGGIWDRVHPGERPREDSSDADLFKYLMRDLALGGVLRQERETDAEGRFLKKHPRSHRETGREAPRVTESAFEDTKPYQLTELGKQFVHYVMRDVAPQLSRPSDLNTQ